MACLNSFSLSAINTFILATAHLPNTLKNTFKMNTKNIVSKIRKELKKNGDISTQKDIQITLLKETLNTYFQADKLLKENGYLMVFNDGKTKGQNPMLKVKFDSLKIIIKLINDIFKDVEEWDETDEFMKFMTEWGDK